MVTARESNTCVFQASSLLFDQCRFGSLVCNPPILGETAMDEPSGNRKSQSGMSRRIDWTVYAFKIARKRSTHICKIDNVKFGQPKKLEFIGLTVLRERWSMEYCLKQNSFKILVIALILFKKRALIGSVI